MDVLLQQAARQQQFLEVIDRDTAMQRFVSALQLSPTGAETVPLSQALNRVLAEQVVADVDVPNFDRANVDGFALQAADSFAVTEEHPVQLQLNAEILSPGIAPQITLQSGTATPIATGGMLPRGADAVIMIEQTELLTHAAQPTIEIRRAVAPGQFIAYAGSDVARGETVLRRGQLLTSREIGILAALGCACVTVYRRPQIAVLSTGDEIIAPGTPLAAGKVYDSNAAIVAAAITEAGGEPILLGIVGDDIDALQQAVTQGIQYDGLLLSGGTSKGVGDLSYKVVQALQCQPGIVAHGVALKPGKPICLAVCQGKPVVILPGFPTSAIFTFHEFVAPIIRQLAGLSASQPHTVEAHLPQRVNSERGRMEFLLVSLIQTEQGLAAYPMGKNSGAVTAFSYADGFIAIGQHTEMVAANSRVEVQLIGDKLLPADLVIMGSHCIGLDYLLTQLQAQGIRVKVLNIGSLGGMTAVKRGECDVAAVHLVNPTTGEYNQHLLTPALTLLAGYQRMQGVVFRPDDARFVGQDSESALTQALADSHCRMINRNAGSGTRMLIDQLLQGKQPSGYALQTKSHNAVAAAIIQQRADWGIAIETAAQSYGLGFIPVQAEQYDFIIPHARLTQPAVQAFQTVLAMPSTRAALAEMGFTK